MEKDTRWVQKGGDGISLLPPPPPLTSPYHPVIFASHTIIILPRAIVPRHNPTLPGIPTHTTTATHTDNHTNKHKIKTHV